MVSVPSAPTCVPTNWSYYQTSSGRRVFADNSSYGCGTGELVESQYTRSGGVCQIYGSCWASQGCKYVGIARLPIPEYLAIRTAPCSCASRCQSKNRLSISDDWNEERWFHDRDLLNRIASPFLRQKPPMILFFLAKVLHIGVNGSWSAMGEQKKGLSSPINYIYSNV